MDVVWPIRAVGRPPDRGAIEAWFAGRSGYRLGSESISYDNPDTGVYFSYSWLPALGTLALHLRTGCADFFLLEALSELAALCGAFPLEEISCGRSLAEHWSAHNQIAVGRLLGELSASSGTGSLPRALNRAIWRWNRSCTAYADRLASIESLPCIVPRVCWLIAPSARRHGGTLLTGTDWPDLLPVALPDVDVIQWSDTVSRRSGRVPHVALTPWLSAVQSRPAGHSFGLSGNHWQTGLPHRIVDDGVDMARLWDALRLLGHPRDLVVVRPDEVLDREDTRALPPDPPDTGPVLGL